MNEEQMSITRTEMMEMKKDELKHYLQMARSAIQPFLDRGESLDDAAGEAFDKVAKLLQLGYPDMALTFGTIFFTVDKK